jgi:16S rRNA (guanine966-N2)-methyltransferase
MRIIAGERRGHKFEGPADSDTRPTSDQVREALFNILGTEIEGRLFIDLFAGTGALGLEALSRGAARAVFVEKNRRNVQLLRRNLAILHYEDRGAVIATDAFRWAGSYRPIGDERVTVFVDPPWRYHEERAPRVRALIARLESTVPTGSTLVIESRRTPDSDILPNLADWDIRRYGGTQIAIKTLVSSPPEPVSRGVPIHGES